MAELDKSDSDLNDESTVDIEASDSQPDESHSVGDAASSLLAKEEERRRLQSDIEAFLAAGGKIQSIDSNVLSDPPKKPESSYGSQPI